MNILNSSLHKGAQPPGKSPTSGGSAPAPSASTGAGRRFLNVSAYRFVTIEDTAALRPVLKERADRLNLRGTILLAPEGINLFIAGAQADVRSFLDALMADARFTGLKTKLSWSEDQPFNRMLVKLKREIITMHRPDVDPSQTPAPRVSAKQLKQWLDEGREVLLVDTRNDFEVGLGTFTGARNLHISSFSAFPDAVDKDIEPEWRERPVVTFCTGGIRCEKAAPAMMKAGFREVYQLDGGILKYFEECGGAHYEGECFVFDKRVALNPDLEPSGTAQCFACQSVLSLADQASKDYIHGEQCPHCVGKAVKMRNASLGSTQQQSVDQSANPRR